MKASPWAAGFLAAICLGCAGSGAIADEPIRDWKHKQRLAYFAGLGGSFTEALGFLDESLDQAQRRFGKLHPALLAIYKDRVTVLRAQGKFEQAESEARWALALAQRDGESSPLAEARLSLASVLIDRGHFVEANLLLENRGIPESLEDSRLSELARLHQEKGDLNAELTFRRARLALAQDSNAGAESIEERQLELARSLLENKDIPEALELFELVAQQRRTRLPQNHVALAPALEGMGACYQAQGSHEKAAALLQEARNLRKRTLGPNRWQSLVYLRGAAALYSQQEDFNEAEKMWRRIVEIHSTAQGKGHPATAWAHLKLAEALEGQDKKKAALRERKTAVEIYSKSLGAEHPRTRAASALINP